MKQVSLILIVLVFATGCRVVKTSVSEVKETRHDSSSYTLTETPSWAPVTVPADSAWIKAYLDCDKNGKVTMRQLEIVRGSRVNPGVEIRDNMIYVKIPVDSQRVYALYKNRFEKVYKQESSVKETKKEDSTVVYKTSFRSLIIAFIIGIIAAVLGYFVFRIFKNRVLL